jgi:patatin-like phospholipase/acyl hydrolase
MKQIAETNTHNALHKRYQYKLKQKNTRTKQLTNSKSKDRTVAIIHRDILKQKVDTFIHDNHITQLQKKPLLNYSKNKSNKQYRNAIQ